MKTEKTADRDLADIKLSASTSFTAREVDVFDTLMRGLLKGSDVRVLLRNPELANVARKFSRMRRAIEENRRRRITKVAGIVVAALLALGALAPVRAQLEEQPCPAAPRALILTRLTWHEAGVDALEDASAIYESITGLSVVRGESWEDAACAYSGRALRGETARSWVSRLEGPELAPVGWPAGASWSVHAPMLSRLLEHADQLVAGELPRSCTALPTDWGDPELDSHRIERGVARGYWRRVSCGRTRGVYLRRSELDRIDEETRELSGGR